MTRRHYNRDHYRPRAAHELPAWFENKLAATLLVGGVGLVAFGLWKLIEWIVGLGR